MIEPTRRLRKHEYLGLDKVAIRQSLLHHLSHTVAKHPTTVTPRDWLHILIYALRDRLAERWTTTLGSYHQKDVKRVYYLSLEFLLGRLTTSAMLNLDIYEECGEVLDELRLPRELITELEPDAALGNGGLGRLAACFLDALATLRLPGYGYGIRYEYGMFYQRLVDGAQVEYPDNWLRYGNPWEFPRAELLYPVGFGGQVTISTDATGRLHGDWSPAEVVMAMAYDLPVPGYHNNTVNNLRLWSAKASRELDLASFNRGDYLNAVADKNSSETLSKVLYPSDSTTLGRELRLRQEYFFVAASIQDILRRYLAGHRDLSGLPDKVAIQLNDTHPVLAIPELLRLLLDRHQLDWDQAWDITSRVFSYTNHTLLPEALETWPVALLERLLPRHLQLIYEINRRFLDEVNRRYPGDGERLRRLSLIGEEGDKQVRMAHLAVVGSHKVNGVAELHTRLMQSTLFADFHALFPQRIINQTNGITPRRWLQQANPGLAALISRRIGRQWLTDLDQLERLLPLADEAEFRAQFEAVKQANKQRLARFIHDRLGLTVNPDTLFDVQVKRIHEYKRQLLNLLQVITRYQRLRANPGLDYPSRTVIFAGKAAPGYVAAKLIIQLINAVADVVNRDPLVNERLRVVFIPNYDVSSAELIIPAADLSQQISTAGTEASGTGNMKLALNGALTIGTLDGATIEIRDQVGADNIFIFGLTAAQVADQPRQDYDPWHYYRSNPELRQVLDLVREGHFAPDAPDRFRPLVEALTDGGDRYRLLADYADYLACQDRVDALYRQPDDWTRKAILNVARMGHFSADRTIRGYARDIWQVQPVVHD